MAKRSAPRFDRLILKLLEASHADNVDINLVKELVAQLPAAAVEVRDIQAQTRNDREPCTCGVDAEVCGMIRQMQVLIDGEQNSKKGKHRQKMIEANQRLLAAEVDLRREIHGHLATIHEQSQELKAAQDAFARSENLRMESKCSPSVGSPQMTQDLPICTPAGKLSVTESSDWTTKVVAVQAEGELKASWLPTPCAALKYFAVATKSIPPHRRKLMLSDSSMPPDPRLGHQLYKPSAWPYTASDTGETSFSRTVEDESAPQGKTRRIHFGQVRVSLPTDSDKRRATENLAFGDIKRVKLESSGHHSVEEPSSRKPLCQGCRFSGAECDHKSRCAECDTMISPCKSDLSILSCRRSRIELH